MTGRPNATIAQQVAAMQLALEKFRSGEVRAAQTDTGVTLTMATADGDVVMVNECAGYGPGDWQWWALGCYALPSK